MVQGGKSAASDKASARLRSAPAPPQGLTANVSRSQRSNVAAVRLPKISALDLRQPVQFRPQPERRPTALLAATQQPPIPCLSTTDVQFTPRVATNLGPLQDAAQRHSHAAEAAATDDALQASPAWLQVTPSASSCSLLLTLSACTCSFQSVCIHVAATLLTLKSM